MRRLRIKVKIKCQFGRELGKKRHRAQLEAGKERGEEGRSNSEVQYIVHIVAILHKYSTRYIPILYGLATP